MIVTTSQSIDGYEIIEYQDILMEKYAYQITLLKGLLANGLHNMDKDAVEQISNTDEGNICAVCKKFVLEGLKQQAQALGADGIIGVSLQLNTVMNDTIVIFGTGTAVKIKKKPAAQASNDFEQLKALILANQNNSAQQSAKRSVKEKPIKKSAAKSPSDSENMKTTTPVDQNAETAAPVHQSTETAARVNQDKFVQPPKEQNDEEMPAEHSRFGIRVLKFIVDNIEEFKNTKAIKDYYLKKVKPEDIEASLVQIMDKRIALERMYGSMKYDTKKDIEEFLGNL